MAHSMISAAKIVGALPLSEAASRLEDMVIAGDLQAVAEAFETFEERLREALRTLKGLEGPPQV